MRTVEVGGVAHELECNAFTPFVYAEEFTTTHNGKKVREDINAAVTEVVSFQQEYELPPMLKLLQLFWAMEKTAGGKEVPSFRNWLMDMPNDVLDLTVEEGWAMVVMQEIKDNFFPKSDGADVVSEEEQAPLTVVAE